MTIKCRKGDGKKSSVEQGTNRSLRGGGNITIIDCPHRIPPTPKDKEEKKET